MPREILVKGIEKVQKRAREIFPKLTPEQLEKISECNSLIIEESVFSDPGADYSKFTFYHKAEEIMTFRMAGY